MKKYNISKPEKYLDKRTNTEKTFWVNVGTLTEFDRPDGTISRVVEIPAIGLRANVFEQTQRTQGVVPVATQTPKVETSEPQVDNSADIDFDNIPF